MLTRKIQQSEAITVSLKKGFQAPSSWCNWFLILSSSSDSRTSLRFSLNFVDVPCFLLICCWRDWKHGIFQANSTDSKRLNIVWGMTLGKMTIQVFFLLCRKVRTFETRESSSSIVARVFMSSHMLLEKPYLHHVHLTDLFLSSASTVCFSAEKIE